MCVDPVCKVRRHRVWPMLYLHLHRDEVLQQLADSVASLRMEKSFIGWDLEQLEKLTQDDLERSSDSDDESEDEVERMLPAPL